MGKIAGFFPIGDTGEQFVVAEWYPDPEIIEAELLKMARDFEDWTEPMAEARELMIESTRLHFETESDPYGKKWTALDPSYRDYKVKKGYPEEILVRTGELQRSVTSEEAWFVDERSIYFRTEVLPPYGPVHQVGTAPEGLEDIISTIRRGETLSEEQSARIRGISTSGAGSGRGGNIPRRMFVGADEETIAEIEAVFVKYLNKVVDKDFGGIVGGVRTTSGLFGTATNIPLFGGGFAVRGASGRFIGRQAGT